MFLETDRLLLRKFQEEDFADYCAYAMDAEMCRAMGNYLLDTEEAARDCFNWLKDREERGYCLVLKETGRVIGNLSITRVHEDQAELPALAGRRGVSLSFCISRDYRRRGLMEEALKAVFRQLFEVEGFDYIHCGYFYDNAPSAALQKKLGFTHLTTQRVHVSGREDVGVENVLWRTTYFERNRLL